MASIVIWALAHLPNYFPTQSIMYYYFPFVTCLSPTYNHFYKKRSMRNNSYHTAPNMCVTPCFHSYWFCSLMGNKLQWVYINRRMCEGALESPGFYLPSSSLWESGSHVNFGVRAWGKDFVTVYWGNFSLEYRRKGRSWSWLSGQSTISPSLTFPNQSSMLLFIHHIL